LLQDLQCFARFGTTVLRIASILARYGKGRREKCGHSRCPYPRTVGGRVGPPVVPPEEHCQAGALKLLGDYTTLRIIDFLRGGELRYTELQRALGDANSVTLTKRLKSLEAAGILLRREATFDRQSVTYSLSDTGQGLLPVLREIRNFTRRMHKPPQR
jgi:DNA-binding HxlR family transcriptional regulator